MLNIPASWRSVSSCGPETGANGDAGCGCQRAAVRSLADSIAASTEDVVGMDERYEKKATVLAILSARVFVTYTLWHR